VNRRGQFRPGYTIEGFIYACLIRRRAKFRELLGGFGVNLGLKENTNAMKSCFLLLLGASAALWAQRPGWNFEPHGQFEGKVVTGEPYSGTGVSTRTQTLAGGNSINESNCTKVYRDTSGRTRREETHNAAACSATPDTIFIHDPVAGIAYVINSQNSTYRQFTIKTPAANANATPQAHTRPANPNVVETSLGAKAIAGSSLSAQGTQRVDTIPAGRFGNAQAITITSTRWYSPDLQIVTESTRTDPRSGTSSYALTISSQAEPAESLFQLPSGLTLEQGHARGLHRAP
jgi:hypothetical protein